VVKLVLNKNHFLIGNIINNKDNLLLIADPRFLMIQDNEMAFVTVMGNPDEIEVNEYDMCWTVKDENLLKKYQENIEGKDDIKPTIIIPKGKESLH
jgi:hypothetical protein